MSFVHSKHYVRRNPLLRLTLSVMLVVVIAVPTFAQETRSSSFFNGKKSESSGFKLPKLELPWFGAKNSQQDKTSKGPVRFASAESATGGSGSSGKSTKSSSPSSAVAQSWAKLQNSTKSAWGKFTSAVNPFDGKASKTTPFKQGYRPQDESMQTKKSGLFFWQNEEPEPIDDVNSFLSQPRPRLP